jgi:hypothetical protein
MVFWALTPYSLLAGVKDIWVREGRRSWGVEKTT